MLAYVEPPLPPSVDRATAAVRVDLGSSSAVEFGTAVGSSALAMVYAGLAVAVPAARPDDVMLWLAAAAWVVGSATGLVWLARTHGQPTIVEADETLVTAYGPRVPGRRRAVPGAVAFGVARNVRPWLFQLRARTAGGPVGGGDWSVLAVAADQRRLRAAADALNGLVGPPPPLTAGRRRTRRRLRLALAAVVVSSAAAGIGLVCAGMNISYDRHLTADAVFVAAIAVAISPMVAFLVWAEGRWTSESNP